MKNIKYLPIVLLLIAACNKKNPVKETEKVTQTTETKIQNSVTDSVNANSPIMAFEDENFTFGEIKQGEIVTHDFSFTNTGKIPLIISNATASCGCTVPEYPKKPILPGESGIIKVKFNSTGFEGEKNKEITLDTNTANKQEFITFKAIVKK